MAKDAFIKIADCDGESTDKNHTKWIEIEDFAWDVEQPVSGSGSNAGAMTSQRVEVKPFVFKQKIDAAYPKLVQACCKGKHLKDATIDLMRATGDGNSALYMQYKLEDVLVSKVAIHPEDETGLPIAAVELSFGKITWTYTQMDHKTGKAGGNITANYDLTTNTVS
jgi:type VI secretion system secreted protein Hcp